MCFLVNLMIYLITGASHTGKTFYAQKLLEKYKYPYLSIDHLKMGLIRSGNTDLTPLSDHKQLTDYLWPIVCEMIKTAIENKQNLIVEGCYVPLDWASNFKKEYLDDIRFRCLIMTEYYIKNNFEKIKNNANIVEKRLYNDVTIDELIENNKSYLKFSKIYPDNIILFDYEYKLYI